ISTSPLHREHKLGLDKAQVLARAVEGVTLARRHIADVEFSAEDALRTEPEFLVEIFDAAIAAGATTINVPDTVGYTTPAEIRALFEYLRRHVRGAEGVVFSSHCHDDLGLAVANSLAAIEGGARQVECTINGIGERAGNCALEELVMALKVRRAWFNVDTRIDTTRLVPTSRLLARSTGMAVQRNKAIVGANAFAHESGIHQDGVLKHRETYEIMRAEDVGWSANKMVMGKHSGRNAFKTRLSELGIELGSEDALNGAFARFKELADKKHEIFDEDLQALVSDEAAALEQEHFRLVSLKVCSETGETPHATVVVAVNGAEEQAEADGGGPVDAAFKAIDSIIKSGAELQLYSVNNITSGT
ncbi:MAG: 2-isopropylmalate synthase, partial [Sulfurimicrobium sp.]|nr:2-isopropylmalate synthase [Sulfurimicrobium sp.]